MPTNRETLLCRYHYDPLDRLVDCTPSAQANTRRFYQKDRLATEIQGAVQRSIMQHDDQLLAQQQRESGTVETRLLATDQQRSVVNVLDATQSRPLAYTPYGHRPLGNGLLSLLGFNGERPDSVTGHYLLGNGYRAFNPVLMRFNSPDSWSPFGEGGLNAYGYCVGDPVNFKDPTGHFISAAFNIFKNLVSTATKALTFATRSTPAIEHIQKSGIMQNIHKLDNNVFIFEGVYKSSPRFNILAHGKRTSTGTSVISSNGRRLNPTQLHSMILDQGGDLTPYKNVRLLSCYSADGGTSSFAAEFSRLTNKPVKGYSGVVSSNALPENLEKAFDLSKSINPNQPYKHLDEDFKLTFRIHKKNPNNPLLNPINYLHHNFRSIRYAP